MHSILTTIMESWSIIFPNEEISPSLRLLPIRNLSSSSCATVFGLSLIVLSCLNVRVPQVLKELVLCNNSTIPIVVTNYCFNLFNSHYWQRVRQVHWSWIRIRVLR